MTFLTSYDREQVRPIAGSVWAWGESELIRVTTVRWNGEEWWIGTRSARAPQHYPSDGVFAEKELWNDLSRFWEECRAVASRPGPPTARSAAIRKGPPYNDEIGESMSDEGENERA